MDYDLVPKSFEYGQLFEAFIVNELHRCLVYQDRQFRLSYLRVNEDLEIDVIVERGNLPPVLIEIKSTGRVDERHAKGLLTLGADFKSAKKYLISNDPDTKGFSDVLACPWDRALQEILG